MDGSLLRATLAIAFLIAVGGLILRAICGGPTALGWMRFLPMSYGVGAMAFYVEMWGFDALGLQFSPLGLALPWLVLLPLQSWRSRETSSVVLVRRPTSLFGIGIIATVALLHLPPTLLSPLYRSDAVSFWALRAKIFFWERGIPAEIWSPAQTHLTHLDYPLLVPLTSAWVHLCVGGYDDAVVSLLFLTYWIGLMMFFFGAALRSDGGAPRAWWMPLLPLCPIVLLHAGSGYADLPFAFFTAISVSFAAEWLESNGRRQALWAALFAAGACMTKAEGAAFVLVLSAAAGIAVFSGRPRGTDFSSCARSLWPALTLLLALTLPWEIFKAAHGVRNDVFAGAAVAGANFQKNLPRLGELLVEFHGHLFSAEFFGVFWIVALFALLPRARPLHRRAECFLLSTLLLQLLSPLAVYLLSPYDPLYHLNLSLKRVLFPPMATAALWIGRTAARRGGAWTASQGKILVVLCCATWLAMALQGAPRAPQTLGGETVVLNPLFQAVYSAAVAVRARLWPMIVVSLTLAAWTYCAQARGRSGMAPPRRLALARCCLLGGVSVGLAFYAGAMCLWLAFQSVPRLTRLWPMSYEQRRAAVITTEFHKFLGECERRLPAGARVRFEPADTWHNEYAQYALYPRVVVERTPEARLQAEWLLLWQRQASEADRQRYELAADLGNRSSLWHRKFYAEEEASPPSLR